MSDLGRNQNNPGTNPAVAQIQAPRENDIHSILVTAEALKQATDVLCGFRGDQFNRAVTFYDLINLGLTTSTNVSAGRGAVPTVIPSYYTPADPVGTASATGVMMGTGVALYPGLGGAFLVGISGSCAVSGPAGSIATITVQVGTGALPVNGAALTGALIGIPLHVTEVSSGFRQPFAYITVSLDYTPVTPIWLDLTLATDAGTATLHDLNIAVLGV